MQELTHSCRNNRGKLAPIAACSVLRKSQELLMIDRCLLIKPAGFFGLSLTEWNQE